MRNPQHDVLFEPVRLGPKTMRNRFWQTPHSIAAGSDFPGFQAAYRGMKAEGGWGAVFVEATAVSVDADVDPLTIVRLWDEGDVRNLQITTDAVHAHGSLAGVELFYGGAPINSGEARHPYLGPTQTVTESNYLSSVAEMGPEDIGYVQGLYVAAALRARAAGFDLITVGLNHAISVLSKFLIPRYNRRTDEYGGSFENRARFARETVAAVREAVGDDCAVGIRFAFDTLPEPYGFGADGTVGDDEGVRFIEHLDDLVDYWDLHVGGMTAQGEDIGPSRTHAENHQRDYVAVAKAHTSKPVVNVGRFTNPDTMAAAIRAGQCDIIGGARPSIADPFLPSKIERGLLAEIRECIGCNVCISKFDFGSRIACTQNATIGEEYRRGWHPERFTPAANRDRTVLVVGAGPAGLECATVLAKRELAGVHLVDARAALGGHVDWVASLPGLAEWRRLIEHRQVQLDRLPNVESILNTRLGVDEVLDYGAEIVVIATGSHWADDGRHGSHMDAVPGADSRLPHVLTPEQVMVDGKPVGDRVVVFDSEGYFMGYQLATKLVSDGHRVTIVTEHHVVSPYSQLTWETARVNRELRALGVEVLTDHSLRGITPGSALVGEAWTDRQVELAADSVVLVTQRYSDDRLYRELRADGDALERAGIVGLYRIGDCYAPNFIAESIYSGHRLAREIDSPDPSRPLPYIRERRLLHSTECDYQLGSPTLSYG
ncbi:MAG TPA: FAD-dependent oxidoreductase [Nocardioides sp.]|uniref:oxidoreductase n=1 Tax=uncultured Nocardioides sp. TaxID=198441 RepID=UPI00261C0B17|nr:FAD-dependent oxidoreductase [uncultured Nocardioides sp.]HRD63274.1 FAD-dependent oxidoreductase [Nocardioides sp.]HRK46749.1 FAD-dependent oxidoreductase [Nocardioides sp.]